MNEELSRKALLLFSGGQDSATALAWALDRYDVVETIGFDYKQRHRAELDCRGELRTSIASLKSNWQKKLGADSVIDLSGLGEISESALTRPQEITFNESGLPSTFVPGRNIIFLTYAAALAYRQDINTLIGGMCEADFSGYPDCRAETLAATMTAINLGMDSDMTLESPLMHISKAGAWQLAEKLGGHQLVEIIRIQSHSCYLGTREDMHDWGYGCGECPACTLRAKGWRLYRAARPVNDL